MAETVHAAKPMTRRWIEQRWMLDNIIQANGVDWDQPRSVYWNAPCGVPASSDFAAVRQRVRKYADISTEFESQAMRREKQAREALADGEIVTARENFFIAAIHWGAAQWPINENDSLNRRYNASKRDCFSRYAEFADHHVEAVSIPLGDQRLPAWLHLPVNYTGGRIPVVLSIPGMDSFKEASVSLYGDPLLSRGFAVLAVDGPGQYESLLLGVFLTMNKWKAMGRACVDWLQARPEVDLARIAIIGRSFGSFGTTIAASAEPRFCAVAVSATCFEPGFHALCEAASPSFKMRLMFMSNYNTEDEFDQFRRTLTWEGCAKSIAVPFLCIGGQADELSPIENAEALFRELPGPRRLVVYEGSRHSVGGGVPSAELGPNVNALSANWLAGRFADKPFPTERWFVDKHGQIIKSEL
jgi:dienelactone hydrolase